MMMLLASSLLLLMLPNPMEAEDPTDFEVLWNVPTFQCKRDYGIDFLPLLKQFGILVNSDDQFKGDVDVLFYENQLGLYPYLNESEYPVNGGIPQLGNLTAHLEKARMDINQSIPNAEFNGLGIIDWESWRPVWSFNWGAQKKYQNMSYELVEMHHPNWSSDTIWKAAKKQWETSAKDFMLQTLQLVQQIRPRGLWCYYLFPDCYNHKGETPAEFQCSPSVLKSNDELQWLWNETTAVCPSIYIEDAFLKNYTFEQRTWYANGRLIEALRVAPNAQLYPYVGYAIKPGTVMVPKDDFWRIVAQTASVGSSGTVIWGASATVESEDDCLHLEIYVKEILGPAVSTVKANTERCAKTVCNGKGKCIWPNDPKVVAWKFYINGMKIPFKRSGITCRCVKGYIGRYCTAKQNSLFRPHLNII